METGGWPAAGDVELPAWLALGCLEKPHSTVMVCRTEAARLCIVFICILYIEQVFTDTNGTTAKLL